ncbi:MAG: metallophosphoesterase family protein [Candidatus Omnitrophica bacterium]|nr:metallophosphoesterase family protein [Candidatus Omnitrophota bacterium]
MKIAVIADVHANLFALDVVLKDAKAKGAKEIWDLGDSVGYSPFPNECLARMQRAKVKGILGNYDKKVLDFPKMKKSWQGQKHPAKYFSFQWASRNLSRSNNLYLRKLPEKLEMARKGVRFLLVHGSPLSIDEALGTGTPKQRFLELAKAVDADVVLCGHSHGFFNKKVAGIRFVNPGSVGRSFDGEPMASYVMLEINDGVLHVKNYRIDYENDKNLKRMRQEKFPLVLIDSIRLGRSIDELKQCRSTKQNSVVAKR